MAISLKQDKMSSLCRLFSLTYFSLLHLVLLEFSAKQFSFVAELCLFPASLLPLHLHLPLLPFLPLPPLHSSLTWGSDSRDPLLIPPLPAVETVPEAASSCCWLGASWLIGPAFFFGRSHYKKNIFEKIRNFFFNGSIRLYAQNLTNFTQIYILIFKN
ncbi:unnamed protein product [Albugo candida]|uniref:Uncharacterized protein n=1 Tax=Albugo candida TaxID=65357 RepID=A0A024G5C7_9STRA|nr:unnamed protein product [Albugo candida]|eukprot:CCI41509.1 unnamed protein product [Albugo candida]